MRPWMLVTCEKISLHSSPSAVDSSSIERPGIGAKAISRTGVVILTGWKGSIGRLGVEVY